MTVTTFLSIQELAHTLPFWTVRKSPLHNSVYLCEHIISPNGKVFQVYCFLCTCLPTRTFLFLYMHTHTHNMHIHALMHMQKQLLNRNASRYIAHCDLYNTRSFMFTSIFYTYAQIYTCTLSHTCIHSDTCMHTSTHTPRHMHTHYHSTAVEWIAF